MEMLISVLLFALGLVLLIKGGDWFVDGALQGQGAMAYGNAIGSIICNTSLIAAISVACNPGPVNVRNGLKNPNEGEEAATEEGAEKTLWQQILLLVIGANVFNLVLVSGVAVNRSGIIKEKIRTLAGYYIALHLCSILYQPVFPVNNRLMF